jgi:hypothetical protein
MIRLFVASCMIADVATAVASLGVDRESRGIPAWLALNGLLMGLPLVLRAMEPLLETIAKPVPKTSGDDSFASQQREIR